MGNPEKDTETSGFGDRKTAATLGLKCEAQEPLPKPAASGEGKQRPARQSQQEVAWSENTPPHPSSLLMVPPIGQNEQDVSKQGNQVDVVHGGQTPRAEVPKLFCTRVQFCGRQFFHGPGSGHGIRMIEGHYIYCALYF